jgi:hypothetical protein
MDSELPPFRVYLVPAIFMMLMGWGGLASLVIFTLPTVWPRWGFFALWLIALTGTALPGVYFLNRRFPSDPPAEPNVIVRQAIWVGVYGATLAWLQLGRVLTLGLMLGLAGGLYGVELLIRMRERSRWRPPVKDSDSGLDLGDVPLSNLPPSPSSSPDSHDPES